MIPRLLQFAHRFAAHFRRRQLDDDLDAEMRSHLDFATEQNIRDGMSPEEARRHALAHFGGAQQAKESHRESRTLQLLDAFSQDIRFALRVLRKSRAFTAVAIFALALGIGANTATFSTSNAFLRNPIAFPEVDRLVAVMNQAPGQAAEVWNTVSPADFLDWQSQNRSFEALGAYQWDDLNLTGAGDPVKIQGFLVTANFFDLLHVRPLLGRTFVRSEDQPGNEHVAILSEPLWRNQFGRDPAIVGSTVRLDGTPTEIVGVMSNDVRFPVSAEIWVPLAFSRQEKAVRNSHYLSPIARLNPGVSLEQAQAEMRTIQDRLRSSFPESETGWSIVAVPLGDYVAGPGKGFNILTLFAVAFVLLLACTNVMNLLLARSTARKGEYAIRAALGASRIRLIRQALVESVLLAMGGMLVGLLLGVWWIHLIRAGMPPEVERFIPGWDKVRLDRAALLYTFAAALLAGIVAGILPAFFSSGCDPGEALKEAGRGPGVAHSRLRSAFVVAEIALSLVLLVAAGLMVRGVHNLFALNFQFDPQSVFVFRVALPDSRYATPQQRTAFFDNLSDQLNRAPGIEATTVAHQIPFSGGDIRDFSVEDHVLQPGEFQSANFNQIGPGFFRTLHIPVVEGRDFSEHDSADAPPVAIVSASLAKHFWAGRSPLGRRVRFGDKDSKQPWATIVGVVEEVNYNPYVRDIPPAIYLPLRQQPASNVYVALRTNTDSKAIVPILRAAVSAADPDQPIFDAMPMDRMVSNQLKGLSYMAVIMGVIGLMALVLSAVGVSGVMAYSVSQRKRETGIRMALGATSGDVLRMFVFGGLKLLALGLVIGLPIAFALARLLSSLLYGVGASDPTSFLGGALILVAAVFLACYIPSRAATQTDPIIALRYE